MSGACVSDPFVRAKGSANLMRSPYPKGRKQPVASTSSETAPQSEQLSISCSNVRGENALNGSKTDVSR